MVGIERRGARRGAIVAGVIAVACGSQPHAMNGGGGGASGTEVASGGGGGAGASGPESFGKIADSPGSSVTFVATPPPGFDGRLFVEQVPFEMIGPGTFVGPRFELARQSDGRFQLELPMALGYVLRYRYARDDSSPQAAEARFDDGGLVAREALVGAERVTLTDTIYGWQGEAPSAPELYDVPVRVESLDAPVIDAVLSGPGGPYRDDRGYRLVTLDRTDVEGRVTLRLPLGPARLVASSDGARFAQTTLDVTGDMSETRIELPAPQMRTVHVDVHAPGVPDWAELRLFGSVPQLGFGYRFGYLAALRGAPLEHAGGDTWSADVALPEGSVDAFVSLGDHFWGRERSASGAVSGFSFMVDAEHERVERDVHAFGDPSQRAVAIEVQAPPSTPVEDSVYFMPDAAGPSVLPMRSAGERRFRLYLPFPEGEASYRYLRTAGRGVEGSEDRAGERSVQVPAGSAPLEIDDVVAAWTYTPDDMFAPQLDAAPGEEETFARGAALVDYWDPDMLAYGPATLRRLRGDGVEWINIKPPMWGDGKDGQPRDEQPEYTRAELQRHIAQLRGAGFKVYLMPQGFAARPPESAAGGDAPWWDEWFASYRRWILWFATLAADTGSEALSPFSAQSLGASFLETNRGRWAALLAEVRAVYPGRLIADGTIGGSYDAPIHFFAPAAAAGLFDAVDGLFLDIGIRWAQSPEEAPSAATLAQRMGTLLAGFEPYEKPLWLRIPTQSVAGVLYDPFIVDSEAPDFPGAEYQVDQDAQARVFAAAFAARGAHPALQGLFTWGTLYGAVVTNGPSVTGKLAEQVLRDNYLAR